MKLRPYRWGVACLLALIVLPACKRQQDPLTAEAQEESPENPASQKTAQREARPDPLSSLRKARDQALAEPDPSKRERLLTQVIWDAFEADPDFAQECFDLLEPGSRSTLQLLSHVGLRLAERDPAAALEWARGIERENEKRTALASVAVVISNHDPQAAAAIALEEISDGPERHRCAVQITQRWVQQDPAAAAAWIAAFPAEPAREAGMQAVVDAWLRHDVAGMVEWVRGSDEIEPWKDRIILSLESEADPAKRARMVEILSDAGWLPAEDKR